jgi:hypothetical protein
LNRKREKKSWKDSSPRCPRGIPNSCSLASDGFPVRSKLIRALNSPHACFVRANEIICAMTTWNSFENHIDLHSTMCAMRFEKFGLLSAGWITWDALKIWAPVKIVQCSISFNFIRQFGVWHCFEGVSQWVPGTNSSPFWVWGLDCRLLLLILLRTRQNAKVRGSVEIGSTACIWPEKQKWLTPKIELRAYLWFQAMNRIA